MAEIKNRATVLTETVGPQSYATGGFDVEVGELRTVWKSKVLECGGGYTAEVVSIDGNKAKVKVYSSSGTEVTNGTDLSGVSITLISFGL